MNEILQSEETVKLYEHEYQYVKPELSYEFLEHHGILGMHWGQRNGPPYPLSKAISTGKSLRKKMKRKAAIRKAKKTRKLHKQKELEKKNSQKSKEDIIKTKDIESMFKNVDMFSNQEINDMLNRLDTEEKLRKKVRELQESRMTNGQLFKKDAKESIKAGHRKARKETISSATENLYKMAVKKVAKDIAGKANPELEDIIEKVFPGPKLKKEENK